MSFLKQFAATIPIIQAPMAGISTPEMAAGVSNAGGIGSIGVGNLTAENARRMIHAVRRLTDRPFNVNVFCHRPAVAEAVKEAAWLARLRASLRCVSCIAAAHLRETYRSFLADESMLDTLLAERPAIVSFHFGLPGKAAIGALKSAGISLIATATSLAEGELTQAAGCDAIVAQGYEAGGHRGQFDPSTPDDRLGTFALTRVLASRLKLPIIAAGGIMDARGVGAALKLGATAAQLGTAFLLCPESAADAGYRQKLQSQAAQHTIMTSAISGRPAPSLPNEMTRLGETVAEQEIPDYPIAYDATKALNAAAKGDGNFEYGPQWAGQGAPLIQSLPAAELVRKISDELNQT